MTNIYGKTFKARHAILTNAPPFAYGNTSPAIVLEILNMRVVTAADHRFPLAILI
jgi:hypothetical protein